jgi:hypothetical protein
VVARKTRSPARRPSGPLRSDRQPARTRARRSLHADRDRGWNSCGSPGVAWQRGVQTSKQSVEDEPTELNYKSILQTVILLWTKQVRQKL